MNECHIISTELLLIDALKRINALSIEPLVLFVAKLCKSDKVERMYQVEDLPKNISIEEL